LIEAYLMSAVVFGLSAVSVASYGAEHRGSSSTIPGDSEIRQLLVKRIDRERQGVGIVVGVIRPGERHVVAYGTRAIGGTPVTGDTVFEIGSMSKVFTGLLLSDMALKGLVRLDEPVGELLPPGTVTPTWSGKQITLIDLATHTAGLPKNPPNQTPKDTENPFADYTVDRLYAALATYHLPRDIGVQYEYSNFGVGLLGYALARRAGVEYGALFQQEIARPLALKSTSDLVTADMRARMAQGYDGLRQPTKAWDNPILTGAGGLKSTVNDILTFLSAQIGLSQSQLRPAMDRQVAIRRPMGQGGMETALGWQVIHGPAGEVMVHGGATGGFRSFMGYNAKTGEGVVVLANMGNATGTEDIGLHLLTGAAIADLAPPPAVRAAISLPAWRLEGLGGDYLLSAALVLHIRQDGARLFASINDAQPVEILPETESTFFWRGDDAAVTFVRGPDNRATALVLHQDGKDRTVPRAR
jgi:D-alanyl-D-alanine-carboxypeptidase/D-alanyl-D-alanine-endopeptidase